MPVVYRLLQLAGLFLLLSSGLIGQSTLSLEVKEEPLGRVLFALSEQSNYAISFNSRWPETEAAISVQFENITLEEALERCLQGSGLGYRLTGRRISLFRLTPQRITISGYLEDAVSGERLVAGSVLDTGSGRGTLTNGYGFFSLQIPASSAELQFSYLGYELQIREVNKGTETGSLRIRLKADARLPEIVVKASEQTPEAPASSASKQYYRQQLLDQRGPGGEADVFDLLYRTTDSQRGADGLGGLFVRGGGADQNLVLLDDTPVFQPAHAFGLFSVINPDIIRSATFYQDGFPARYGGRLSSVMDIRSREGNTQHTTGSAEVNTFTTKLLLEIPTVKDKGGILLAARRTHLDPFLESYSRIQKELNDEIGATRYHFYDLNLKAHHSISDRDRLYLSVYRGGDVLTSDLYTAFSFLTEDGGDAFYEEDASQDLRWGNSIGSLRWNHLFNDQLFVNTTLTYSRFAYQSVNFSDIRESAPLDTLDVFYVGQFESLIQDFRLKVDADYYAGDHHLTFGASALSRRFIPGAIVDQIEQDSIGEKEIVSLVEEQLAFPGFEAGEFALYAGDEIKWSNGWSLMAGLRLSAFTYDGQFWLLPEPRFSLGWQKMRVASLRLSLSRMNQYLHLLSSSGASLPTDLWVPASRRFGPQSAWQTSLAGEWIATEQWTISGNAYYKHFQNLVTYDDEVRFPELAENLAEFWEEEVVSGEGNSLGFSTTVEYSKEKIFLSGSYLYQRSLRQFNELNFGESFPFSFDRPHKLSFRFRQKLSPSFDLFGQWEISSGRPVTLVRTVGYFEPLNNFPAFDEEQLTDLNDYRLPVFHRFDLSGRFRWSGQKTTQEIRLGVSNLYNRKNVYFAYEADGFSDGLGPEFREETSLPLLPMLSYRIAFSGADAGSRIK